MKRDRRVLSVATPAKVGFAREQRAQPTRAEELLWSALRRHQLGVHFRRQHPLDRFVLDFYCGEAQLAVEVDGPEHANQHDYDQSRDTWLNSRGIKVLRIAEDRVRENLPDVLRTIRAELKRDVE